MTNAPEKLLSKAQKCQVLLNRQMDRRKTYNRLLPLIKLSNQLWDKYRATLPKREYKSLEQEISDAIKAAIADKDKRIGELEAQVSKLKKRDIANDKSNKSAPRKIVVSTSVYYKTGKSTGYTSKTYSASIVAPKHIRTSIKDCTYIREDIANERIKELETALNEASKLWGQAIDKLTLKPNNSGIYPSSIKDGLYFEIAELDAFGKAFVLDRKIARGE